jgi:hypothetical protein
LRDGLFFLPLSRLVIPISESFFNQKSHASFSQKEQELHPEVSNGPNVGVFTPFVFFSLRSSSSEGSEQEARFWVVQ